MNKVTRDGITQLSEDELNAEIERYSILLDAAGKQMTSVRNSINTKMQALIDELLTR